MKHVKMSQLAGLGKSVAVLVVADIALDYIDKGVNKLAAKIREEKAKKAEKKEA